MNGEQKSIFGWPALSLTFPVLIYTALNISISVYLGSASYAILQFLTDFYMKFNLLVSVTSLSFEACPAPELLSHLLSQVVGPGHSWSVLSSVAQYDGVLTVWKSPERGDLFQNKHEKEEGV